METVKTLTLTSWDDANEEAPLKIAVHDQDSNNPFSLAFSRGHYDVARAVLEIARAQYAPAEKPKTRYWMETEDSDDESTCSDDSGPRIYSTIVGRQSTIDDIGQVSMKVQSRTKPQAMIGWTNPLRGRLNCLLPVSDKANMFWVDVITKNDMQGLKFLLDMFELYSAQKLDPDDQVSDFYYFPDNEFKLAVQLGRVELLREIIRRTGAGLPLKQLVRKTGLELKEKPEYYQGLTVYGKKRCALPDRFISHDCQLTPPIEEIGQPRVPPGRKDQAALKSPLFCSPPWRAGSRVWSGSSATHRCGYILPSPIPRQPARMRG